MPSAGATSGSPVEHGGLVHDGRDRSRDGEGSTQTARAARRRQARHTRSATTAPPLWSGRPARGRSRDARRLRLRMRAAPGRPARPARAGPEDPTAHGPRRGTGRRAGSSRRSRPLGAGGQVAGRLRRVRPQSRPPRRPPGRPRSSAVDSRARGSAPVAMPVAGVNEGDPPPVRIGRRATNTRVVGGQPGRTPGQHHPVYSAQQPQRGQRRQGVHVLGHDAQHRSASQDVIGGPPTEVLVHWGSQPCGGRLLPQEHVAQPLPMLR